MRNLASMIAAASLLGLLAACSGGGDSPSNTASSIALTGPTPALAGTVEVGGQIGDQASQVTATGATVAAKFASGTQLMRQTASAAGSQLTAISTEDPRNILGNARVVSNPWNPRGNAQFQLVSLPPDTRTRLPTGKWSKGFFYQSPVNLNAYFTPKPEKDSNNKGGDTNQFSVFAFPNKLNLDDRIGMVAVSFPARRYIAYGVDPTAAVYDLRNPYRADTLLYHIAPNFNQDIRLSYAQTTAARLTRKIDAFDELTVSTSWSDATGKQRMQLLAAEGSPYVTVRYAGLRPVIQVGQGSQARTDKNPENGLPLGTKNYAQQESINEIVAVAVGEEPLKRFIENDDIRNAPALTLTGTKFRFVYKTPDRAQALPGTNDNQEVKPVDVYKELVVYVSSPITLAWDTPSRSYVATGDFNGVLRTAFVDDVRKMSETNPALETISDIPSFRSRRAILDRYAATFPVGSEIFVDYAGATGMVRYKWAMERMDGQTAQGGDLLMMGFDATHIPSLRNPTKVDGLTYRSNFGMMSAIAGNEWAQTLTIPDILRNGAAPNDLWMGAGTIKSVEELNRLLKSLVADTDLFTKDFLANCNADSYGCGKYLHNLARMALIANYLAGESRLSSDDRAVATAKRTELLEYMKRSMNLWLDGKAANGATVDPINNTKDDIFVYDATNGGLITSLGLQDPKKDYSNREYIDHMFHYGYFIYTASVIAQLDPNSGWLDENSHRAKVDLLVRDIANPSLEDEHFPIVRTFDWFRMQNIADAGPDANGGNTESSSESVNSNYALLTWGVAIKDDAFQALAAIMSAAEIRTAQAFYQVTPQTAYLQQPNLDYPEVPSVTVHLPNGDSAMAIKPSSEPVMNILRGNIAETNTFFGPLLANRIGINLLPITPMSDFIISRDWAKTHAKTLLDLENRNSAQFAQIINTVPSVNADCFLAGWDVNDPPKNEDGTPQLPNPGEICAGRLRILYSWRQLLVAANALNDPNGAYQRYTDIMDRLDADQQIYMSNTDQRTHPGSSRNDGIVADVLKDISTPSTNTNTLWWVMTHR